MLTTVLQATGIQTNTNKLSVQAGGLVQADNCVIDKKDVIEIRRGFNPVGDDFAFSGDADNLFVFQGTMLATNGTALAHDTAFDPSDPVWTTYSGTFNEPNGASKIHAVEGVNSNLYFTSSAGVYKIDAVANTPYLAGGPAALDGTATVLATGTGWFDNHSNVAYQVVWGYIDANNNTVLGNPSELINASNNSGAGQDVSLTFTVPSGLSTSYFWQLYRSAQTDDLAVVAGVQFQLVAQANLTAGQIAALSVTYTDQTPDNLKGAYLYTDTTQQGPLQTNDPPPLCVDMCYWKNMMFYLNISSKQRAFVTVISVGSPSGIQSGDTFIITSGATVLTFTGAGTQDPTVPQFKVDTSSTPAANIDATARNLVACINQYAGNSLVYAYYISGYNQLPGQILLQERGIGGAVFTVTSSRGGAYSPVIPSSGTTYASTNTSQQNGVAVSKVGQPEAVPLVNLLPVGAADQAGYRILPLTDAVYVLKADGVFRITGDNPSNLVVTVAYPDTILTVPESAVVLNNSIYAYTNQGIVTINQSEPQLLSFPIEDQLLPLQTIADFAGMCYGVAYPADRKYVFGSPTESTDTHPTQEWVYNYITQAWTRWDRETTGGLVNPNDNKLYFCSQAAQQMLQERKSYTVMDYADESFACLISDFSGTTITVDSTADAEVGMSLAQPNTAHPNLPVTSVITEVTDATHLEVTDELQWSIGNAAYYTPIDCTTGYAPAHGGFPLYLKHFTILNFEVDQLTAKTLTGQVSSDLSPYKEDLEITPILLGFGDVPFGIDEDFGGVGFNLQPLAALVPQEKARAHWLNVYLNQNEALRKFVLAGATAQYEITSARMH
jgi:hypothetical protein